MLKCPEFYNNSVNYVLVEQIYAKREPKLEKLQEMILQWFLVLHDVENNIQKVYQNPPIRKSKNLWVKHKGFFESR